MRSSRLSIVSGLVTFTFWATTGLGWGADPVPMAPTAPVAGAQPAASSGQPAPSPTSPPAAVAGAQGKTGAGSQPTLPGAAAKGGVGGPQPGTPAVASLPMEKPEKQFSYDPANRRDPFRSLIVKTEKRTGQRLLPPLQRHDVSDIKLVAVVWGQLGNYAMLELPDGKGYSVRVGTRVGPNHGVVKRITTEDVTVTERFVNFFGETRRRDVVLKLRTREEEVLQ